MPGIMLHYNLVLQLAREARDRTVKAVEANPEIWPPDAIIAVLLAAASAEAFINELGEYASMEKLKHEQFGAPISPNISAFADAMAEIEQSHGSTLLKYLMASQVLGGKMFEKGQPPYQDFAMLFKLRDAIVHLKPRDNFDGAYVDGAFVPENRWPKFIYALQQRGLARRVGDMASWFNLLMTKQLAEWSCKTAYVMMEAVFNLIPSPDVAFDFLKAHFSRIRE
ncbi:MAG: hypothetical protein HY040_01455 [Planctomycetes bacterium]|nr:hypothetical protein [Planctomycetota bacterium]